MTWESVTVDPSASNFIKDDPLSIVPKEWEISNNPLTYAGHRRGNDEPGNGDFIPLWLLTMLPFGNRVFFVLRPNETPESFFWYTGMTVEQAAMFVEKKRLIPQILVNPNDFKNSTFDPILKVLENEELMTFHANTYETLLWRNLFSGGKTNSTFEHLKSLINNSRPNRKFSNSNLEVHKYHNLRGKDGKLRPLMPELEKLKSWVSERIAWQYLEAAISEDNNIKEKCFNNVKELEDKWLKASPIEIYKKGHFIHYTATPKYYAKYGITWFAEGEDYQVCEVEEALKSSITNIVPEGQDINNSGSKYKDFNQTDGSFEIKVNFPRFYELPTSFKEKEKRNKLFNDINKYIFGSDADRFLLKIRSIQSDASPSEMISWGNSNIKKYIEDCWEPMVKNFAAQEGTRQLIKFKALQIGTNLPFILKSKNFIESGDWNSIDFEKDIKSFWYLMKSFSGTREEYMNMVNSRLQEVEGVAFLRPKSIQLGGVVDIRPSMKK